MKRRGNTDLRTKIETSLLHLAPVWALAQLVGLG